MRKLSGKKALVTGAASGIGRAIALRLAQEGTSLFLVDMDEAGLEEVVRQVRDRVEAVGRVCDLTHAQEISSTVDDLLSRWGHLDILVNNAGIAYYGPTDRMTDDQWRRLFSTNLHAPVQLTLELLPTLLSRPEAHILNVASILGLVGLGRLAAYSASKFALVGFSESLRLEYGRHGLGVTALCPGFVQTRLFDVAACGHENRPCPRPPRWLCTTPEKVAVKAIRALRRDKRLALVTGHARLLFSLQRYAPWVFDAVARIGRRGKMKRKAKQAVVLQVPTLSTNQSSPTMQRKAA